MRPQIVVAAIVLVLVLTGLSLTIGLDPAGWVGGLVYLFVGGALLTWAAHRSGHHSPSPADTITLTRTVLIGGVSALVVGGGPAWSVVGTSVAALILDLVDGHVARRTRTVSSFGARFDMEADAFLLLVLSVYVAVDLGPWVLLIGMLRYLFVGLSRYLPWLGAPLPWSRARKVVAAIQGVTLTAACAPILPAWASTTAVAGALAALLWSFGRDTVRLWDIRGGPGTGDSGPPEEPKQPLRK